MSLRVKSSLLNLAILVGVSALAVYAVNWFLGWRQGAVPLQVRFVMAVSDTGGMLMEVDSRTMLLTDVTANTEEFLGYRSGEMLGLQLNDILPIDMRQRHEAAMSKKIGAATVVTACDVLCKSGQLRPVVLLIYTNPNTETMLASMRPADRVYFRGGIVNHLAPP